MHDVSRAWDVWYYHLPFAARLTGIVPKSAYVFGAANEARFHGFPLLGELVQGILWRVTGRPEAANVVAYGSLVAFVAFARARLGAPASVTALALFAVPLIHIHGTAAYVDLPANLALSALVLLAIEAWAAPREARVDERTLAWAALAAAVAVNTKTLSQPVATIALAALLVRARRTLASRPATIAAAVAALALVYATPLKNAALHGNPWFPLRVSIAGHALAGTEAPYASSPDWLAHAPQPARFVVSVLEIGVHRWSVDQWTPPDDPGYRMGGFFGAYVLVLLAAFAWCVARRWRSSRRARASGIGFLALTVVVAFSPQSHELRYYLDWVIVLVALVAWLAATEEGAWAPRVVGGVAVAALAVVLVRTSAGYVYPSGWTFADLVKASVDERIVSSLHDGETICVAREPYDLLWAAPLHPGARAYVVKEAEEPRECAALPAARLVR